MSGVSFIFFLSPTATLQSRYAFLAPSRAELCRFSCGGRPGVIRGEKDPGVSKPRNRVAAKAGIGRYSGAVHGSNTQRGRRRRPTLRPDGRDENSSGDENDSAIQVQDNKMDTTYEESAMDGVIHDDGEPAKDRTDSHQRYLDELGIINHEAGREYQLHTCNEVVDGSTWVPIGTEGDMGYQLVDIVAEIKRVENDRKGPDGAWKEGDQSVPGSVGDRSGKEDRKKDEDSKSSRGRKVRRNKANLSESIGFVAEVEPVAVTVISNPELFSEQALKDVQEDVNSVTSQGDIEPGSSVQSAGNGTLEMDDMNVLAPLEVSGKSRKQRKRTGRKDSNIAAAAELPNDERQVRIVEGEAEQPSVAQMLPASQRGQREKGNPNTGKISVGPGVGRETTVRAVIEPEEREENSMVEDSCESPDSEHGTEEFVSVPEVVLEPVTQSKVTLGGFSVDPVDVCQQQSPSAFSFLDSEQANEVVGERSEFVNTEAEKRVIGTDTEAGIEDTVDNGQLRIEEQANVGRTTNSCGTLLDPRSSTECSNDEFRNMSSVTTQNGPAVLAMAIRADDVQSGEETVLANPVMEQAVQVVSKVAELPAQVANKVAELPAQVASKVAELPGAVVEQATQVSAAAEQVVQVAESVTSTANQVVEQVTEKVTDMLSFDEDDESDSDDEFESYKTSDDPAFRGSRGLANFVILQEDQGVLSKIYDLYTYMLKQPLPNFSAAMFSAPIIVSVLFTLLYLPEYKGLAFDDTARDFFAATDGASPTLQMSWGTVFQVFMFSISLSTGLQPELAPLSPYTLIVANINALVSQLVFVFLSGAVFARLSQPAQPVRCSTVALVSTSPAQRKRKENAIKVLMTRYVLAGPQPCELVDVKVDLTYKYNTITRTGSYFRATQSLKLVRPEIAFLTHGMLVRHVIDSTSPLYQRTAEMLKKEDAVFVLSVVGLERSSMQSVFHVQHYCVCDDKVIWDAEFEDLILINSKKSKRIVDHSRLSMWRPI